ncbi:MAG: hypothetical protein H7A54_12870 [Akkermansiaceae bacterium]|nr:hypothetical protein [Akkermansiaceae bacterium]
MNRVWQYHFGHGIVASASEFGTLESRRRIPSCSIFSLRSLWSAAGI